MGLRFRKSIKIAPGVKVNLNKSSTSVTVGTKGKHYTVNSKGKTTKTIGIPGTGLSYSTTSSNKPKKAYKKTKVSNEKKSKIKKKHGCLTPFLVVFTALLLFAMIPSGDKETEELPKKQIAEEQGSGNTTSQPENVQDANEDTLEIDAEQERIASEQAAAEQAEKDRIAQEQAEAERIAAEQAEAQRLATEQAEAARIAQEQAEAQRAAAAQAAQQQMVWISETGSKYHSVPDCGRMNPANAYQMSLSDAEAHGYGRCSKCH